MSSGISLWQTSWKDIVGLPDAAPEWVVAIVAIVCIYLFVIFPSSIAMAYFERKLSADLQARVGPNRAGPAGMLQPLLDLLKLLQKSFAYPMDRAKDRRDAWSGNLWLSVHTMALYSTVAVLPLGSMILLIDTEMSVFLPFWATLVLALGTMLLGLGQFSVPGWFGGIRVAAQALAGAFPALITILCAGVRAGSFRWSILAESQGSSPFFWALFSNPFQFMAFIVFVVSGLVLMGIPPLDGGLSISDIHGGVTTRVFGRRLILFKLGRFYGFFLWSLIAVVLFMGAWLLPETVTAALRGAGAVRTEAFLELGVLFVKAFVLMMAIVLVSTVTPKVRSDQITDFSWKVLSPAALLALAGASLWVGWGALT